MKRILYVDRCWESPYAMSAFVALREKGLPFETRDIALEKQEHHAADYGAVTGRVPALQEDGFWLAESSAIAEYLEDAYPPPEYPPCFPQAVRERAVCREVQGWLRSDLLPIREERPTTNLFCPDASATEPLSPKAAKAVERLVRTASRLIPAGRTTLFESFCIADVDLALMLMRLQGNGDPLPDTLARYAEVQWQRESVRAWVEHPRPTPYEPH